MREIKSRGIDIHTGKFVYGDLVRNTPSGAYRILNDFALVCNPIDYKGTELVGCSGSFQNVNPITIGQFTGLKDKNGKDIYDGDLLREPAEDKWSETSFVAHEVFWHDNDCADSHVGWQMNRLHFQGNICGTMDWNKILPKYTAKMEVIGNIHENKDLLK